MVREQDVSYVSTAKEQYFRVDFLREVLSQYHSRGIANRIKERDQIENGWSEHG